MDVCPICLEDIQEHERYELLKCPHCYHKKCILKWLERSNTCPQCRQIIPNIFSIETKNYGFKEKNILEINYLYITVYDKELDKIKFKIMLGDIFNALIFNNKLQVRYYQNKKIKVKNLYFKDQNYSVIFYKLLQKVYNHFLNNYVE